MAQPRNAGSFFEKVEMLIERPDLRRQMSVRARESAEAYEWGRVLRQMVDYYEEMR